MELNVKERLLLLNVVQQIRGDVTSLRILNDLMEDLGFTEVEIARANIRQESGSIRWDEGNGLAKDVEVGERATELVREQLKAMSEKKQLTFDHLTLWDRFELDGD